MATSLEQLPKQYRIYQALNSSTNPENSEIFLLLGWPLKNINIKK